MFARFRLVSSSRKTDLSLSLNFFLAAIVNEKPILDNDGNVQVFTLLLNSSKTKLIEGYKQPAEYRSLKKLNGWLVKKFNLAPNQLLVASCFCSILRKA
jgi:hypothetical protein